MKTILCPTDFSKNASNAIEYASQLASSFQSHIVLLHVFESPAVFTEASFTVVQDAAAQLREQAEEKLNALRSKLLKKYRNVRFEPRIVEGASYDKVVEIASEIQAELIVMGTTGRSKLDRLLMGSTTARVIHHAHCPVLCIPKDKAFEKIKKIVYATDMNEDNLSAAKAITEVASKFEAEIVFVFVDDKHLVHADEDVIKMTKKIRARVKYPKISGYISKNKSIAQGLEFFLKKYPADMLVMFAHEKHFPQTLFNQSITKIMSYQTKIPLLALKA